MNKKQIKLTYFTPTYNREKLLPNLYKSLLSQTNKNFIWLIIDDGSVDGTEKLVKSWQKENKIIVTYIKKENGGKHTAIDLSNKVCETEFICCIDSDDYLTNDATEVIYSKLDLCDDECCGLLCPKKITNSPSNNKEWNLENQKIYFYDLDKLLGFIPETTIILKTQIAKLYHFPIFKDERFVTESVYYQQFFYDYKFLTFNYPIYIAEYQPDGYTQMGMNLFFKNPKGYAYALKQNAYFAIKNRKSLKFKMKKAVIFYSWLRFAKIKDPCGDNYPLPFIYRLTGKCLSPIFATHFKKIAKNIKK